MPIARSCAVAALVLAAVAGCSEGNRDQAARLYGSLDGAVGAVPDAAALNPQPLPPERPDAIQRFDLDTSGGAEGVSPDVSRSEAAG